MGTRVGLDNPAIKEFLLYDITEVMLNDII